MHVRQMLSSHPRPATPASQALVACIEACYDCAQACISCADACLAEPGVPALARCIRLDLDCADACATTGAILSRRTEANAALVIRLLETCADFCRLCADECEKHAGHHDHCRVCAEVCRTCERACQAAATDRGATGP